MLIVLESDDILNKSSLERIEQLDRAFRCSLPLKGFSLFGVQDIHSEEGVMLVDPLIDAIPQSPAETDILRRG